MFEVPPVYVVLFEAEPDSEPYKPLIPVPADANNKNTYPHGLDREVIAALPGLWYCLHLPNWFGELIDLPPVALHAAQSLDLGHHILLAPAHEFTVESVGAALASRLPILALCPDEQLTQAEVQCELMHFALPPMAFSELSNESLKQHWESIYETVETDLSYLGREPHLSRKLRFAPTDLPRRWLGRQFTDDADSLAEAQENDEAPIIERALDSQVLLNAVTRLANGEGKTNSVDSMLADVRSSLRFPIVLAAPGVSPRYARTAYGAAASQNARKDSSTAPADSWPVTTKDLNDASAELSTIRFVATHRAIAHSGVGIELPQVPSECFVVLAQLEDHMQAWEPKGRTVKKFLDQIADLTADFWTPMVEAAVARASNITAFSNFPLGLLRLPGDTASLSARVPITYRPLIPLTRTVQAELAKVPLVNLSEHVRVLITECIPESDPVGKISRSAWEVAQTQLAKDAGKRITLDYVETPSVAELRATLQAHTPDILIISAHGDVEGNVAGINIGGEVVAGPELGSLPPVVILSACRTAPRGSNTVNIADLIFRQGAIAVLSTQVPVHVRRNAILTVRLLVNIAEVLGGASFGRNLLQVWRHVQGSNAMNDILSGNPRLEKWGSSQTSYGISVIEEFMTQRSTGRLSTGKIYDDTEKVLGEIADDMGCGDLVRNWFTNPGYVPESLFYAFSGSPDRIHFVSPNSFGEELDSNLGGQRT